MKKIYQKTISKEKNWHIKLFFNFVLKIQEKDEEFEDKMGNYHIFIF